MVWMRGQEAIRSADAILGRDPLPVGTIPSVSGRFVTASPLRVDDKGDIVLADKRTAKLGKLIAKTATIDELTVTAPNTSVLYSANGIISGSSLVTITALTGTLTAKVLQGGATARLYDTGGDPALLFQSGDFIHYVGDEYLFKIGSNTKAKINATGVAVDTISELTAANGVSIDGVALKDGGATLSALLSSSSGAQFRGNPAFSSGAGVEIVYQSAGFVTAYDRDSSQWTDLYLRGYNVRIAPNGGAVIAGTDPGGPETLRVGGTARFSGKITTVSAVPASFADLTAVRTWLATQFA